MSIHLSRIGRGEMFLTATGRQLNLSATSNNWPTSNGSATRTGGQGNDVFYSGGAETLRGLGGDDTYQLFSSASVVQEGMSAGVDTVVASFWGVAVLAANVENLVLASAGSFGAVGNDLDNIIQAGPIGASLWGMGGDDVLVGGIGADSFRIVAGQGSDAIVGFQHGWDAISLEGYGISSFAQILAGSQQVGEDVSITLGNGEILVLRDVEIGNLHASDFNLRDAVHLTAADQTYLGRPAGVLHANGWSVLNNTWGSSGLHFGTDYVMEGVASSIDATAGTTFSWSYALTSSPYAPVRAYPEVIYGFSPFSNLPNAAATRAGFPASVADILQLDLAYDVAIGGNVSGFNVAYDIWFTNKPNGTAEDITTELMIWVHQGSNAPFGTLVGEYVDGDFSAQIYNSGTYIALILDSDQLSGTLDLVSIIDHLIELGLMDRSEFLASIELGSEVFSGSGSLTINNFDFTLATRGSNGWVTVADVTGSGTTVSEHEPVVTDNIYQMADRLDDIVDGGGVDTILSTISRDLNHYLAIENLTLQGNADINAVGNAWANILVGNNGNNVLDGRGGADRLEGGLGNDTYVLGSDISDTLVDTGGVDTITSTVSRNLNDYAGVENLSLLGTANIDATGNGAANLLVGNSGNNVLNGGGGVDALVGGLGDDTYVLGGDTSDTVIDTGGVDTITSAISRDLGDYAGIENLLLLGTADIDASGTAKANLLVGNVGDNLLDGGVGDDVLDGSAGNDSLIGGQGRDVLTGGVGSDTFIFHSTSDSRVRVADVITDFTVGQDVIDISTIPRGQMTASGLMVCTEGSGPAGFVDDVRWFHDNAGGVESTRVELDVNGDGQADFQIILNGNIHLSAGDFIL